MLAGLNGELILFEFMLGFILHPNLRAGTCDIAMPQQRPDPVPSIPSIPSSTAPPTLTEHGNAPRRCVSDQWNC